MNWITNYVRPKINSMLGRRETPENLWVKDPESGELVFHKDLEDNHFVVPYENPGQRTPSSVF
jgi:acetyl-CoA carboxylase carboxyl transferase subunit beta